MSNVAEVKQQSVKFQSFVESNDLEAAQSLLKSLKISLTKFPAIQPCGTDSNSSNEQRIISRSILEWAAILYCKLADMSGFERTIAQLRVYYADYSNLPASSLHYPILGMRLLQLLVENRMAEFHGELEGISECGKNDVNIAFPMKLEQYLMEGSYSKVLEARVHVPNPFCQYFMTQLLETVRDAIADCAEVAYVSLTTEDAKKMLILDSDAALNSYVLDKKNEWKIHNGILTFKSPEKSLGASDIPSMRLVQESLIYATELDRIV